MSDREFRPPAEGSGAWKPVVALVVVAALAGGGWWYWQQQNKSAQPDLPPQAAAPGEVPAPPKPPPPLSPAGPEFPVEPPAPEPTPLPELAVSDPAVKSALDELLGAKAVLQFLQVDGFVRRVVATVDNLPREHAASRMWPVQPTGQRFTVAGAPGAQTIAPDNAARYTPFVQLAESVDPAKAVAAYRRMYPLFQRAYEELGFPARYFNDRLVAVIDHLLQTPEPTGPLAVRLLEVKGEMASERPWVRYEFADPTLEALSSGQKALVRMGPENERRLKAKLRAFRTELTAFAQAKEAAKS